MPWDANVCGHCGANIREIKARNSAEAWAGVHKIRWIALPLAAITAIVVGALAWKQVNADPELGPGSSAFIVLLVAVPTFWFVYRFSVQIVGLLLLLALILVVMLLTKCGS